MDKKTKKIVETTLQKPKIRKLSFEAYTLQPVKNILEPDNKLHQ
jgi:hypothetical protein